MRHSAYWGQNDFKHFIHSDGQLTLNCSLKCAECEFNGVEH